MIPKPKEAVDISWNWVGWKVPVNHIEYKEPWTFVFKPV